MRAPLSLTPLTGEALASALPALAQLRIEVFRAFPYLYDGTIDYEQTYLSTLAKAKDALIVAAREGEDGGGRIVGCATGSSMEGQHEAFAEPLKTAGIAPEETFYCSESVLLADWRGRGAGHGFFDHREAHARARGYRFSAFCAVVRPDDHPARPKDYSPLDPFWRARGYAPLPGVVASFSWLDVGDRAESAKPMQVWLKRL